MLNKAITLIVISILAFYIFYYSFMSVGHIDVSLENITFASNNTDYNLGHTITNNDLTLYYFYNTTYPIPTALYSASTSQIRIYNNCTSYNCADRGYPNVTNGTGTYYYASYSYYAPFTVWGTSYLFIFGLILLIVGFIVALALIKYSTKK